MFRLPPTSTLPAPLFPYTTLFRSAVFQRHERLRLAALADAAHLAGDDHGGFRPPAAAFLGRAVVLAGGPQRVELAEVAADQRGQLVAVGIERVATEVVAKRVAPAGELLREGPFGGFGRSGERRVGKEGVRTCRAQVCAAQ